MFIVYVFLFFFFFNDTATTEIYTLSLHDALPTYAMARGWNEFWLAWIGVDLVGVPFAFATDYVPTAVLYTFYGLFVLYGFTQWVKVTRVEQRDAEPELARSSS